MMKFYSSNNKWQVEDYKHDHLGQVCDMLRVYKDNLSSMIYLSSNKLSDPQEQSILHDLPFV